jgi:Zn ribbon nucleic-acid-binding protein
MGMTIINNYEMPSNCYMCDLHNYHECDLTGESIEEDYWWNGDSREKHCPLREVEAIHKDQYEARLKADMVAMLEEIQLEIEECEDCGRAFHLGLQMASNIIQQKIDKLKENTNDTNTD